MTPRAHHHGAEELCEAGLSLYARALREGHLPGVEATAAPCLLDKGILHPAIEDPSRLEPVPPAVALQRLLRSSEERITVERRRGQRLADAFEPLMRLDRRAVGGEDASSLRLLSTKERVGRAIAEAMAEGTEQLLAIQPHDGLVAPPFHYHEAALERDQAFLDQGGRVRALYQHTVRHAPLVIGRYERLRGDVEARTLDQVTERLIIVDHTVAFIPANADRSLALEVRHPALVAYFVNTFDRLWHLATPMHPRAVQQPTLNGITPRQRAIAALLIEGHTDNVIAERLGMNVRTARVHIAKLAATLGSESRAQLGYLIGQSGILDRDG
ncbi:MULTISPECIES: helix-turn-helix transcriptional regulator [Streptomyces]|uniref:helix-turn-helix transcriptional regulator n=1 Tax=Streptomyces TaxID=1883 RepID=UPI0004CBD0FE|nr:MULTISPECIES: LuxR C-terminal-related transcriptional regulator [unclassified Streptomyces]WDI19593.1 LuxR C-terminal-related transcriptional regulator [Streptomyces enissocaesilis]MBQ0881908.1 helix-turn-helix transcriptional regulator [Streptomyces sp. RT42]MBQ0916038.1 helix-turn-helix transcriptional regulator [Streptomyces sp. RM99]MDI3096779.1 LuxR C-terminal-related transcriptional regulator [Streptomyces sp. AN-3]QCB23658.1 helix-turn-helix transcriptional regulator [Streptomyces sp